MQDNKTNRDKLYAFLTNKGVTGIGANRDEFETIFEDEEKQKKLYDFCVGKGYTGIGKDYDEFAGGFSVRQTAPEQNAYEGLKGMAESQGMAMPMDSTLPTGVIKPINGNIAQTETDTLKTFGEGVKQGADALWQGSKYAVGEWARVTDGSQRDYQEALKVMNSQNFDASTFDLDKALEDDARARFEKEYADYRKVISQRRKEREGMGFFEGIKHKMDDPEMPTMKSARELGLKNLQHQKPLILVKEALEEAGGDAVKAREIIEEKAGREAWSDRTMREASEALDQHKPVEGWAWWGQLLPQTAGQAAALGANLIPGVGRYAGPALGYATTAGLTLSSAGSAMNEARQAGASDEDVFKAGLAQAIIEYGSEKIPLDRLMGRTGAAAFKKGYKGAVGDAAEEELERLLTTANKKLGGKLLSGKTAKALIKDMGVEGASEFVAEGLGTFVPIIYEDPENYPTLREALLNGWEGAKAGIAMGGFLGGGSLAITNRAHNARRKKQGHVVVAEDLENGVVEVLSEPDDNGVVEVLTQSGEVVQADNGNLGPKSVFTYEEWKDGEIDTAINREELAFKEGYDLQDSKAMNGAFKDLGEKKRALGRRIDAKTVADINSDPVSAIEEMRNGGLWSDEDVNTVIEYVNAKARYDGMIQRVRDDIDGRIEESDRIVDERTNRATGMIQGATMKLDNRRVYVVNGNLVQYDDGSGIDIEASDNSVIVRDAETGALEQVAPEDIFNIYDALDPQGEKAAAADAIRVQYAQEAADKIEGGKYALNDIVVLRDENGNAVRGEITAEADADGRYEVTTESPINGRRSQMFTRDELDSMLVENNGEVAVVDDATDNVAPTGDNMAPVETAPVELPDVPNFFRLNGTNYEVASRNDDGSVDVMVNGKRETLPAGTDYSTHIPTDKKGEVQYEQMPVERTHEYFVQKVKDDEARAEMIEKRRKKAESERKKFDKKPDPGIDPDAYEAKMTQWEADKKAAQAKVDYWNEVAKRDADITRSETREAVENIKPDVMEETADEFIANQLAGIKITPESFKRETGLSNAEQAQLVGVISNDGVSVERAAEIILENYDSELAGLGFTGDVQDVRDIIIGVLSQGNPRSYAKKGREAREAENMDQQRADAEVWAKGGFNMTLDELYLYEETILPRMMRDYEGFDENEYYSNLAENNGYDTTRESESIGRGGELLQGEQPVPAGGTPVAGQRNEEGTVSDDVQGGGQNGVAQEEVPVNEPVGNSEQLSSSEIPNNQSVAEGDAPGQSGVLLSDEVANAEAEVNTTPTDAQKEAGNYKKGHVKIGPFNISIEQPKGSVRSGVDKDGKKWEVEMQNTYGYFRGTEGVDGDHIDVFLSNDIDGWNGRQVFVVDQRNADGSFDEHKVMLGFNDINDAEAAYMSNYKEGWQGLGAITGVSIEEFEKWISSSHRKTKAFAEYKNVKTDEGQSASADKDLRRKLADQEQSATNPSGNRLVTDERYAELRERMRKKLGGQMNIGIDPEILAIGTEMAVYHIEKGARKFADFAKGMIADLGDAIRPYLKAFYNGARELPEIEEAGFTKDMTPYEEVKIFDVANFDKPTVDAMATAETVTREAEVAKDVETVKAPKKSESAEGKKLRKASQEDLEGNPVVYYKGEKHRILMLIHRGEQTTGGRFTKPEITRVYLENMQDVKVDDLYVEDTAENISKKEKETISSRQTSLFDNLNDGNNGTEEIAAADNSGARLEREELSDTEQVGTGVPVQDTARNSRRKRRNTGIGSSKSGNGPQYDVNRNYTNEKIEEIVSSVTGIVDGKVVVNGEVTDDIRSIARQYKSGGIAKMGRGILDEYYTDGKIVDAVNMLIAPYFDKSTPVRVLEPSVGIGNFIEAVNDIPTSEVVAFEINETTARIAKVLYPNVEVNLRSFETEFIDESGNKKPLPRKYSLVIGNPPYGSHRGLYKGLGEESKIARYEDYFVKRSLDVLDEGGVLAMVLPSSWMDRHTKFGGYTIERAYRLPSGAFEATQVGTDIVILKKDSTVPVTEHAPYFEQFPERVLGEVKQRRGRYGRIEEYVEGDIDAAIEAIKKENAEQLADLLGIEKSSDAINDIQSAVEETGSTEKAVVIVKDAKNSEKTDNKPTAKQGKYKVKLNKGVETVPTSAQFTHEFSDGEVEAFADTDYEGALSNPDKHKRYANYIGGQAVHDFYYAEGDIYSKLGQLEQEKEYIVENYGVEQYKKQKTLLEGVLPKQKSLEEITISPNTAFVKNLNILTENGKVSLKDMFVDFCRKLPYQAFGNSSAWEVIGYVNNEQVHGTDKSRNQRIRERRKRTANDLFNKFLNEELSDNAKKQVVAAFNREYNSTYRPDYSKVPMFSTINRDFKGKPLKLTSVQLAGIGRMTVKGVGVLAHEVGFGKTLSGILAMHEAMTRGFAKKPLIVVPNDNILKQWVETIGEVLPNATVNTLGNLGAEYDLTDFKVNDGEFTIITYEGLKAMSFSDGTYNHLASKFSYITEDLNKHQSERDIQKRIEKKNELKGKMKRGTKSSYMFEDFGFDWLTVDEVHNANHIVSKVRLDKSVASDFRSQSQRTSDLGLKTWLAAQYIQEENNGRNVLLLSATPFTNKPLEYYSILSLVGNDMLERKGFFNVDQFFATFMEADNELEIGANGRPVQKTNVRRFRNNGLFQQLLSEFIDIKGEEDNPELVRPERVNKEYKIAQNELTAEAMAAAQELLGDNDTVLQGIGHARAAAFSPYATSLLGVQPKNHKEFVKNSPKIDATIKMIEQNIKDRPDAGQIVYSEVGVEYFPLIRDYLVKESGLKPNEVRIITGATSNNERVNIQSEFNDGKVKVVIGSPAIKEGLNLQGNTTDMYILSLPWNFTQLRQIEGRGWRQGNKWENIRINYMLTNDSVDVFMLQRLQLKQGLYNEAMKSGAESLDVSDIDTAELKTALITDPAVRAEIVTVQEREKLQLEKTQIEADLSFVMRKYEAYNKLVNKLDSQKNTVKLYKEWAQKGDEYWAQRAEREEAQLKNIENEIEEEKQDLAKKGVNVDYIVRQTEQAQNDIVAIQEKIDNLKEFQEELTQRYREENEAKAKEQDDLLSTYIKERKAENKGFYKIRPAKSETKAAEEETEDDVLYRSAEDNEARAITYDKAVQIADDFAKAHKGATKKVVFSKGAAEIEQQMRDAGFTDLSIEVVMSDYKSDDYPTAAYMRSSDGIVFYEYETDTDVYSSLWHENAHRAMRKIYGDDLSAVEKVFNNLPRKLKERFIEFLKSRNYAVEDYPKESVTHFIESVYQCGEFKDGNYEITRFFKDANRNAQDFANFVQQIINYIEYGNTKDGYAETRDNAGNNPENNGEEQIQERNASSGQDGRRTIEGTTAGKGSGVVNGETLDRQGAGPLTDREVVMGSDVYSKVLGKPRYYGKKQREYVARMRAKMEQKANELAQKLNLDNVEVVTDTGMLEGKRKRAKGFYSKNTGKITIVIPNHSSVFDVEQTLLHEAVAHHGLRQLFGKHFDTFLDNVFNNVTEDIRRQIVELASRNGWDFHTATEEYLASLAEDTYFKKMDPSVWNRIKGFFMEMLAKAGLKLDFELNDNELRYILWRSYRNLAEPGSFRSILGEAADVAKQYELKVGNYAADTKQDTAAESDEDLYREGNFSSALEEYNMKVRRPNESGSVKKRENLKERTKEAYFDSMRALKILQEAISKETGNSIQDYEDAYLAENRMSSSNMAQMEIYDRDFYDPLKNEILKLVKKDVEYIDIIRYLHAKHGIERNEYMRRKAAEKAARKDKGPEPAAPRVGDADYKKRLDELNVWREELEELTEEYVKKFAKRDYSGLTALTNTVNAVKAEAAAQAMIDGFEGKHNTDPLWKAINNATKETLRKEFVSGIIDRATYDSVRTMFNYYIPLRGWDSKVAANEYEYLTNNKVLRTPTLKTSKGRRSLADDPIATIGFMAGNAIARGNRNLMKQKLLNFVLNNPTSLATVSEQWYVKDNATDEWMPTNPNIPEDATPEEVVSIVEEFEANMLEKEREGTATRKRKGLNIGLHATKQEGQEHVVRVKRNGKEYCIYINGNPRAAQAVNGLTNPDVSQSWAHKAAMWVKNRMARMFTSQNPAFIVTNLSRDIIWAGTVVATKENPEYVKMYTKNITKALAKGQLPILIHKFQKGTLDANNELERYFIEFMENGGETGFTQINTVEDYKRNIKRFMKEAKDGVNITTKAWRGFWGGVEFLNRSAEDTTRFMVYMTSRQMGRTVAQSIWDAKEVTVNFNKKGSGELGAKYLNFAYIFFNATMQALSNFGKLGVKYPWRTAAALSIYSALGFFMPMINAAIVAMFGGDEEDYWDLPEWVRRNNIVMFAPWTEKGFITIPLPHELRPFYGMGEAAYSALAGKEDVEDAIYGAVNGFTGLLPLDYTGNGGNALVNITPTIFQPYAQVKANVDYFGKPIYRDNPFNENAPEWTKAYKGTNRWLVGAAEWLNMVTGGNEVKRGLINLNPAVVEHLIEGYTGGLGKTVNKTWKTISMLWDEDMREARNIPVISSFYQEADERSSGSRLNREYFEALEEKEDAQFIHSGYRKRAESGSKEYQELLEEFVNSKGFRRLQIIKNSSEIIKKLDDILKNSPLTEEQEKKIKDEITYLKTQMLKTLEDLEEEEPVEDVKKAS